MAVANTTVVVTDEATLIASNPAGEGHPDASTRNYLIKNITGTATVFTGDATVDANGFPWEVADAHLEIELEPGESYYGIVTGAEQTLKVQRQGR